MKNTFWKQVIMALKNFEIGEVYTDVELRSHFRFPEQKRINTYKSILAKKGYIEILSSGKWKGRFKILKPIPDNIRIVR